MNKIIEKISTVVENEKKAEEREKWRCSIRQIKNFDEVRKILRVLKFEYQFTKDVLFVITGTEASIMGDGGKIEIKAEDGFFARLTVSPNSSACFSAPPHLTFFSKKRALETFLYKVIKAYGPIKPVTITY